MQRLIEKNKQELSTNLQEHIERMSELMKKLDHSNGTIMEAKVMLQN